MYTQEIYKISIRVILFAVFLAAFALPFVSGIRINEIMYDLNGSDTGREWVEVYNDGSESLNLSAWKFYEAETKHGLTLIQGSWSLDVGAYFVIADNSASFLIDNPSFNATLFDSSFSLSNTGESISLWNGSDYLANTTYSSSSGAAGDGNSLQFISSTWQSCLLTPGYLNSCQSQNQTNQTLNDTQQNQTNQTQQNQTNQTSQNQSQQNQTAQTSKNITLNYQYNASFGKNITFELYSYNLDETTYDVKLAVYDGGSIISETYNENEAKWKSSTYYINSVFYGAYIKRNFTLRIKDNGFEGMANISVKLRKSGTNNPYIEYSGRINILKTEKAYKSNESIININPNEDAEEDKSSDEDAGVIRLNDAESKTEKGPGRGLKAETGSVIFMSQTERIKKYAIYGFAVFLIVLIIILLRYRRI